MSYPGDMFIHDLGLVMLAEQYIRGDQGFPYQYEPVETLEVPTGIGFIGISEGKTRGDRRGTIVIRPTTSDRYVVTWQDTDEYCDRVATYLQS